MSILRLLWSIVNPADSGEEGENIIERILKVLGTVAVVLGALAGGVNTLITSLGGG